MRFGLLIATMLACAGCGLTSSPADGLTFTAPPGWSGSPGIMGFMQFWKAPDDDQVLMLFKSPKPIKESDVFSSAKMNDVSAQTKQAIEICGNRSAEFVTGRGSTTNDSKQTKQNYVQLVMTTLTGSTYFALYVYPIDRTPDPRAEAAIRELCPKP